MQDVVSYLFHFLPQIVSTVEFTTFIAALALVSVAVLLLWTISRRH